jgi:glycosyltransferase involved in cell wall biosynthesis
MRVTHIITRLVLGGAQENTVATVLGLRDKSGVAVNLISGPTRGPEGSLEPAFVDFPGLLTIVPPLVRPVHPWKDVLATRHLTRLLRAGRPDIVHTHSGKAGILGRLAARRARVPIIIHHIHGPSFGPFQGPVPNFAFGTAEKLAGRLTTHFLCSANAMTRLYLEAGIGRPEMYTRVFSGFQVEPFLKAQNDPALRAQLGVPVGSFVVGKIGRLAPLKGHEDLLVTARAVLAANPETRFLIVGDGILRSQLEASARTLKIADKVIFTGLVPPAEVARYVGVMDCLVHLSSREAVSRALPQAMAAGKPVIAYNFDGADEVCIQGKTGFITPIGDTDSVARHLLRLASDNSLRVELGRAGQKFASENFRVEQMVDKIFDLYRQLCSSQS